MYEVILDRILILLGEGQRDISIPLRTDLAVTSWRATGLDSLGVIELAMQLEAAFACEVTNDMLEHVETFGDLAAVVAAQLPKEI